MDSTQQKLKVRSLYTSGLLKTAASDS